MVRAGSMVHGVLYVLLLCGAHGSRAPCLTMFLSAADSPSDTRVCLSKRTYLASNASQSGFGFSLTLGDTVRTHSLAK